MVSFRFLFLLMLLFCGNFAFAQCDGNLGENIFTEGDFGSGAINVPINNPNIAPGYAYTSAPAPVDGFYTITNNTGGWANLYDSWLVLQDNSPDPNGYMMVVNASFEPGLFYEQVVDGLCENTLYEFSADIINMIRTQVTGHIEPNVSFLLDGQVVYTTGNIPQSEVWNTYGFTFTTAPGQTSITLSLSNNAPGGIGNDLALDNISFRACGPEALILPETVANICEDGDPLEVNATIIGEQYDNPAYQWQYSPDGGVTWIDIPGATGPDFTHTELLSGAYYYRYLLANGDLNIQNEKCRVVSNVKVINVVPKFYDITDTICEGLTYTVGTSVYTNSGVYVDSLISSLGCDSIVTLDLTITPDVSLNAVVSVTDPACTGNATGSILIEEISNGAAPYTITFADNPPGTDTLFTSLSDGQYLLTITDFYGCTFEETYSVVDPVPLVVDIGMDTTLELGQFLEISPFISQEIDTFFWSPADLFPCDLDCLNPLWAPTASTPLILTAYSPLGCVAEDTINIEVVEVRKVYIPNIFSPNFDGTNDNFTIFGELPNIQMVQKLVIFNRWGGVVFEANDFLPNQITNGWDGTIDGKPATEGVYVYLAEVLFLDQALIQYAGDLMLVR